MTTAIEVYTRTPHRIGIGHRYLRKVTNTAFGFTEKLDPMIWFGRSRTWIINVD